MRIKKIIMSALCILLSLTVTFLSVGCMNISAADLMDGIEREDVEGRPTDDKFKNAYELFSVELFKKSVSAGKNDGYENVLVSPLSVMIALSMCANGADGETLSQMETALGNGMSIEELNKYLYSFVNALPSYDKSKLEIANSIWFRDTPQLKVERNFLQMNANYYGASIYRSAFDSKAVSDINNWVSKHTDGMIDKLIEGEISESTMLMLINAIAFDAEWAAKYNESSIKEGIFKAADGKENIVDFMYSEETVYLSDDDATGFIKNYKDGKYGFAAILPNDDDIYAYIDSLTDEKIAKFISNREYGATVNTKIPKFTSDFSLEMSDLLKEMGITDAFTVGADFGKMGSYNDENLSISKVIHKTYISVDENGTKAAAVTGVTVDSAAAPDPVKVYNVFLDRPFVYMIIDNSTGLPIFIGTVTDAGK